MLFGMNILDAAIQIEDGVARLAEAIDVKPNVISNWRNPGRGIPRGWEMYLMNRYGRRAARLAKKSSGKSVDINDTSLVAHL